MLLKISKANIIDIKLYKIGSNVELFYKQYSRRGFLYLFFLFIILLLVNRGKAVVTLSSFLKKEKMLI